MYCLTPPPKKRLNEATNVVLVQRLIGQEMVWTQPQVKIAVLGYLKTGIVGIQSPEVLWYSLIEAHTNCMDTRVSTMEEERWGKQGSPSSSFRSWRWAGSYFSVFFSLLLDSLDCTKYLRPLGSDSGVQRQ